MTFYENVVAWLQTNLNQTIDNQEFYSQLDRFGIVGISGPAAKLTEEMFHKLSRASLEFGAEGKWEYVLAPDGLEVVYAYTPHTAQALAQEEMDMYMQKMGYPDLVKKYDLSTDPNKCSKMPHEHALIFVVAGTMLENRFSCYEEAVEMIHFSIPQVPEFVIEGERLDNEAARKVMVDAYRLAFASIN